MNLDQTIARLPSQAEPTSFDALRADGIARLENLAGELWTDYNLHDPGVTLLEALCFSLTELAYRADFPVADLLAGPRPGQSPAAADDLAHSACSADTADTAGTPAGPEGLWDQTANTAEHDHIDWPGLALHLPTQIFPARATTCEDLRSLLLDSLPQLDNASVTTIAPDVQKPWAPGLYNVVLDEAPDLRQPDTLLRTRELLAAQRNLGEDLGHLQQVQKVACLLHGQVVIGGAREASDIVAEVFEVCAAAVAHVPVVSASPVASSAGQSLDELLCGPLLMRGRPDHAQDDGPGPQHLFMAELMASVAQIDGVAEVLWLGLQPLAELEQGAAAAAGQAWQTSVVTSSLPRRSANGLRSLWLAPPQDQAQLRQLSVARRGNLLLLEASEIQRRFAERRAAQRTRHHGLRDLDLAHPAPRGVQPAALPHLSVQHLLPGNFGVGQHGLPETASDEDKARAQQLQAYLMLYDQALANGRAQLQHLRQLYSVGRPPDAPSAWWASLGPAQVPGLPTLLDGTPQHTLVAEVLQPFDDATTRRHQVLDRLLALHGQTYSQNSLRQYSGHLLPTELDAHLLRNKTAFVRDLLRLGRDRAAGVNLTLRSWGQPHNCAGLQRQVSLLLGFEQLHTRSLSTGLRGYRWVEDDAASAGQPRPAGLQRLDLGSVPASLAPEPPRAPLRGAQPQRLGPWLLQVGAAADHYGLLPGADGTPNHLVLGPDDAGHYRVLAAPVARAERATLQAARLRQELLRINRACEGLHVVEHLLLRPMGSTDAAQPALTLSVVFPNWTVRCGQANFQRLAEESVRMACPAHLRPQCLWLGWADLRRFETLYLVWLRQRARPGVAEPTPKQAAAIDAAAAALHRQLLLWSGQAQAVAGAA